MQCDNCGNAEAVVQLTQVENNEMRVLHLCEACAGKKGVEVAFPAASAPLADFLAQIGKSEATVVGRCPACGLTATQLRQVGRLGCATCYTQFQDHLRSLLRRLHGGTQHVGKMVLPEEPGEEDRIARIRGLRRSLQRAVEAEDFEHAASLRDQIRRLESTE